MALVLNNAQSELLPIEIGRHQIGSGMTIREYARRLGMPEDTLTNRVHAARVLLHVQDSWSAAFDGPPEAQMSALDRLSGEISENCMRHLAAIHAAPEWLWPELVGTLLTDEVERSDPDLKNQTAPAPCAAH